MTGAWRVCACARSSRRLLTPALRPHTRSLGLAGVRVVRLTGDSTAGSALYAAQHVGAAFPLDVSAAGDLIAELKTSSGGGGGDGK